MITQTYNHYGHRNSTTTLFVWVSEQVVHLLRSFSLAAQARRKEKQPVAHEAELIKRAKNNDPDAWDDIFNRYYPEIYAYTRYRAATTEDAEDLAAAVFERAVRHIHTYKTTGKGLGAWLQRIASNLVIDYYRRQSVPGRKTDELPPSLVDEQTSPLEHAIQADSVTALHDKLQQLPPAQQDVLVLRFLLGYNLKETAEIMGKKANAIKALQHRALERLRIVWYREVK